MDISGFSLNIPPFILLIPYILGVIIYLIFGFFNMYHLLRFGSKTKPTFFLAFSFVVFTLINITITILLLWGIDWANNLEFDTSFDL